MDATKHRETKEFQAETKQLLDLMIHSIYTNREIFLRELISNASDAIDKIRFQSLTDLDILEGDSEFAIWIDVDEANHTLSISDNGIGMTYDEVVENVGTIAKSGTKLFLENLKNQQENPDSVDLIGKFGVGFYSAFMVADKVTLVTRAPETTIGVKWESTGDGTYTIEETSKEKRGTTITLTLKEDHRGAEKSEELNFLNHYTLQNLIKKYSDYIRYPIKMQFPGAKDDNSETVAEVKTLNSMQPLWTKAKNEITTEEYNQFYESLFHDWKEPAEVIHSKVEGMVEYTALLFIPSHLPFDFYSRDFKPGIRLYSRNVFIMEHCPDLLPEYLRFVRGLVDSSDFSLNISREILQHNRQLKLIGKNLEKSVLKTLENMLEKDRAKYETWWQEFGKSIKAGIYMDFQNKAKLQELLLFHSSHSGEGLTTLKEYLGRMKEGQTEIYYVTGTDRATVERLPQMEIVRENGYEILYCFDPIDEFAIDALSEYEGKKFKSVSRGDLSLNEQAETEKEKQNDDQQSNDALFQAMKEVLKEKVADVKPSQRLKSSPVCLVSGENGISISMEHFLSEMEQNMMKATRILEVNPHHEVFAALKAHFDAGTDSPQFKDYCELLYGQAILMEGLRLDDPVGFAEKLAR
ncbi:MAG TPA: molecular chaperone HtpG, partial [Bacillota bacterium]|nr:molecular chaperone HtpG [Bacillota bacterium]